MKLKNCPYISFTTLIGNPSNGTCNLFPEYYNFGLDYRFVECENVPISRCFYKLKASEVIK